MDVQIALNALTILDIQALALVDEAYQNRVEWIKKSISTTAKVCAAVLQAFLYSLTNTIRADGQVQLRQSYPRLRPSLLGASSRRSIHLSSIVAYLPRNVCQNIESTKLE